MLTGLVVRVLMHGLGTVPIRLRTAYSHRTVLVIGQVDVCTLQTVDSVVIFVTLLLGAHTEKRHAGCVPP